MRLIGLTGGVFNFAGGLAASPFRWWWGTWRRVTVSHLTGLYFCRRVDWRALLHPAGGDVKRVG